jgi:hypothetical protein
MRHLRMILSENRYPSPIGVEDMLFGIMRYGLNPSKIIWFAHILAR